MIVLSGADLVLPDRILAPGTMVIDGDRIAEVRAGHASGAGHPRSPLFAFHGHYIVPGFIDVHVHGVDGFDTLDDGNPVSNIAARMPRFGVTAFCPTTMACAPDELRRALRQVRLARKTRAARAARVLPAHIESNFINPQFRGAQPLACLRSPRAALAGSIRIPHPIRDDDDRFSAPELLAEIERSAPDAGIVTLAPELDGGLELIAWLTRRGHLVSLGHSGATYEEGIDAIAAGASQATHLFNRMPPMAHRAPGLAGAILGAEEVAAELICDGVHVHPAMVRTAIAAKRPSRIMAITDATAAAGLGPGKWASIGGQAITAGVSTALLRDGTVAGSLVTMDRVFRMLVEKAGVSLIDAATVCATTPARELKLVGYGVLAPDAIADLVVLDSKLEVVQTYISGQLVYSRTA
jgi:N-acetylglucosamine-6-phosphate deacetylase